MFTLDTLIVTRNPASTHTQWVTPVAEGGELMVNRTDLYEHLETAEGLADGARVLLGTMRKSAQCNAN